ncbi:MAG: DUF4838 domain-containing protein [Kiritimatiellae bacterium]|nr:DUF4838 domain-containing protein [Kiritimatiellia bacterium]
MKKTGIIVAVAMGLGLSAGADGESFTLTRDGQPASAIVLSEKPPRAAQFAAFELQEHIKAISGAALPIVRDAAAVPAGQVKLHVGDGPGAHAAGLTQEGFKLQEYAVKSGPEDVVLVGKDAPDYAVVAYDTTALGNGNKNANWPGIWEERGTLHAVYDFLQDGCGVRWFNPTDTGSLIPRQPTLTVKAMNRRRAPTFRYRDCGNGPEYVRRVSFWRNQEQGYKAWETPAFEDFRARNGAGAHAMNMNAALFMLRMRNGGELCRANHSMYHFYELYWSPSENTNAAKYFIGRRPDIFAQGHAGDPPPQLCYTSTGTIDAVAREALDYFANGGYTFKAMLSNAPMGARSGENYFCVEPMDNGSFCKCAACQKLLEVGKDYGNQGEHFSQGMHSDYMFNFVNDVARKVKGSYPDKNLVTLAYGTHAWLPKTFKLDPYVAVQFCFTSSSAPWFTSEYEYEWRLAQAWGEEAKVSGRPLYAWSYSGHLSRSAGERGNFHFFPGFFGHALAREMKMYQSHGYRGMYHCGLPPEMDTYVLFRLMDNADLDADALLDEYFTGMYGAASAPLKKFYLSVEKVYCDPKFRPTAKGSDPQSVETAWGLLGTAERMAEWGKLVDEAKALAKTEREKKNVALFELSIWQYMKQGREKYVMRKAAPIPSVSVPVVAAAAGDGNRVAWDQAAPMTGGWFQRGADKPAPRAMTGRMAHDGEYLYFELTDACATKNLTDSPSIAAYDDWEIFTSTHRGTPYRQFLVGPTGRAGAVLNGEVNWQMYVRFPEHGVKVVADTSAPDKWVSRIAIPLKNLVPGGAKAGDTVYINVVRVSGPAISGAGWGIDTWVPFTTVHELDRAAEIVLQVE